MEAMERVKSEGDLGGGVVRGKVADGQDIRG